MNPFLRAALALVFACPSDALARTPADVLAVFTRPGQDPPFLNGGLLVCSNGTIVLRQVEGLADFATGTPLTTDAVFQTASLSKPFTATAILQLRDRGSLNLDDRVSKYLRGFPYRQITIRHLLTHTSGLPDLELFEEMAAREPGRPLTGADLVPALKAWSAGPAFAPGEQFRYANTNYQLLARIVETASGMPFGVWLRENVFRPADMASSYVLGTEATGDTRAPVSNHVYATLYDALPQDVRTLKTGDERQMRRLTYEAVTLGSTLGDQNVFTTLDDLARFDAALRSGRLLSAASQEEAYAPTRLRDGSTHLDAEPYDLYGVRCSYGMGWEVCDHPKLGRLVGHAGYNQGIQTVMYRNLDRDRLIVMFDNGDRSATG